MKKIVWFDRTLAFNRIINHQEYSADTITRVNYARVNRKSKFMSPIMIDEKGQSPGELTKLVIPCAQIGRSRRTGFRRPPK